MASKQVYVWGSGGSGQLGLGDSEDHALPQKLDQQFVDPETILTGGCHTVGLDGDSRLYLWGDNEKLQLGTADIQSRDAPTVPTALSSSKIENNAVHQVACGWWNTLAVVSSGNHHTVYSWGSPQFSVLGRSTSTSEEASEPFPLQSLPPSICVRSIACGWKHALLSTNTGSAFAWGVGRHGQLGLGPEITIATVPTILPDLNEVAWVGCGWEHSVFQTTSGQAYCCGSNRHGQVGSPSVDTNQRIPKVFHPTIVRMENGDPIVTRQLDVGWHFTLCTTENGSVIAWGRNTHGQLGVPMEQAITPVQVSVPSDSQVVQVTCGSEHSLVLTNDGKLFTCGWNEHGNLGHGDHTNRSSLQRVAFFSDNELYVLSIKAGGAVSIAITK